MRNHPSADQPTAHQRSHSLCSLQERQCVPASCHSSDSSLPSSSNSPSSHSSSLQPHSAAASDRLRGCRPPLAVGICGPGPPNAPIPKSGLTIPLCVVFSVGVARWLDLCTASFRVVDGELFSEPGTSRLVRLLGPMAAPLTFLSCAPCGRSGVDDATTGNRPVDLSLRCRLVGAGERSRLASEMALARASIFSLLEDSSVFTPVLVLLTARCRWL